MITVRCDNCGTITAHTNKERKYVEQIIIPGIIGLVLLVLAII